MNVVLLPGQCHSTNGDVLRICAVHVGVIKRFVVTVWFTVLFLRVVWFLTTGDGESENVLGSNTHAAHTPIPRTSLFYFRRFSVAARRFASCFVRGQVSLKLVFTLVCHCTARVALHWLAV